MHLMHLTEKLRLICSRYDLTQEDFAKELGIAQTTVGRWLNGTTRPYDRHLIKVAEKFAVPIDDLLNDGRELPKHITDGRDQILRRASEAAAARYPGNPEAGQEAFEALAASGLWQVAAKDIVAALRKQAEELLQLAHRLERTTQTSPVRLSAEAELAELTRQAEENLGKTQRGGKKRSASGG